MPTARDALTPDALAMVRRDRAQRQLRRRGARARQGALGADLQRAPARGCAGRAAVRSQFAPGDSSPRPASELLRRGPAPAAGDRRGGQPRQAGGDRLGDAVQRSPSTTSSRSDGARAVRSVLRWTRAAGGRGRQTRRGRPAPGTRLRLRTEVLAGTLEALVTGQADLAIGVGVGARTPGGMRCRTLGELPFVFASRRTIRWPRRAEPLTMPSWFAIVPWPWPTPRSAGARDRQPAARPGRAHGQQHAGQARRAAALAWAAASCPSRWPAPTWRRTAGASRACSGRASARLATPGEHRPWPAAASPARRAGPGAAAGGWRSSTARRPATPCSSAMAAGSATARRRPGRRRSAPDRAPGRAGTPP